MKTTILFATLGVTLSLTSCKKEEVNLPPVTHVSTHDTTTTVIVPTTPSTTVFYSDWESPAEVINNGGGHTGSGSGQTGNTNPGKPTTVQYFTINAPAITQDILDKGVVLTFCRLENDNGNTRSLPTTTMINNFISIWDFTLKVGKIQFMQTTGNPYGIPPISKYNKCRYVIIPPTKHVRLSKPLKDMSYDEICTMYNLPK